MAAFAVMLLLPHAATAQVSSPEGKAPKGPAQAGPKYEVYAGFGYSSLNQVNQSRFGLMGVDLSATRDWGKYFGLSLLGNYYKPPLGSGNASEGGNPGDPSIYEVLAGPEIHANIYGNLGGFIRGTMGGEHTGGESETPNISFAGGFGGGMTWNLSDRLALRASGDKIGASFSLRNNNPQLSNSPHRTWNSNASIGILYRF